jgi:MFS family permease
MHGLYLLWWVQEKGIPAPIVAAVLAAGDLALLIVEVPTGWLADRFGHRASLVAGSLLQVLGIALCWIGLGIPELVVASVLVALADGFRSGADQALLYRSCQALGREDAFQRLEARARASEQVALVGLVLAGGAIVDRWGFGVGWAAEVLLCGGGLAIALLMVEPPGRDVASHEPGHERSLLSTTMVLLIVPAALLGALAGAGSFLAQTRGTGTASSTTALVAMITLAEAIGSTVSTRAPLPGVAGQMTLLGTGLVACAVAPAAPGAFLPTVVVLSFLSGLAGPLRAAAIQRLISDGARARAASLASACDMACSLVALPLAGLSRRTRT